MLNIEEIMHSAVVIPVITINDIEDALPLAEALLNGGLKTLEITLRTEAALEAITLIKQNLPEAIVGAGTVINTTTLTQAISAGAEFIVSPGMTIELLTALKQAAIPVLPGVNTPSEVMRLLEQGISAMKFFPAEAAGGVAMLKALSAPLPQAIFCPTGGINPDNARDYLRLSNVACVGGSWMLKPELIAAGDWGAIEKLAKAAADLTSD